MGIHRVRLSDEEIVRIARALSWFSKLVFEKGLLTLEERMAYEKDARRFQEWGEIHRRPRRERVW